MSSLTREYSQATLILEDGTSFLGRTSSNIKTKPCEIVFNTAMTGYQEVITDPSYHDQIVVFSYPHIGNIGVNQEDQESKSPKVAGVIVKEMSRCTSNWRAEDSLIKYLEKHGIPWIEGIDTRKLVKHLRTHMNIQGVICPGNEVVNYKLQAANYGSLKEPSLQKISVDKPEDWVQQTVREPRKTFRVAIIDFGVKHSILKTLHSLGGNGRLFPPNVAIETILGWSPDGIILSNGPGDPKNAVGFIPTLLGLAEKNYPILGICFGCQIIALAFGGMTSKMFVGHHGINHPVIDLRTNRVFISSQNHNFVVEESQLPNELKITHRSLFDGSIQGIRHTIYPIMALQGHPEGNPGPQDLHLCFHEFLSLIFSHQKKILEKACL